LDVMRMGTTVYIILVLSACSETLAKGLQQWEQAPTYREVNPGGDVIMPCLIKNKKGDCRWEKDGVPVGIFVNKYEWAGDRSTGDCSIKIMEASLEYDDGVWQCQVTASSFKHKDTLISEGAELVVRVAPKEVRLMKVIENSAISREDTYDPSEPIQITGEEGDLELSCSSTGGNPAPRLVWFLGEEEVKAETRQERMSGEVRQWKSVSRITLPVTSRDNQAVVSCQAINEAILTPLTKTATLNILYAPRVSVSSSDTSRVLAEGEDSVKLSCAVDSNPPSTLEWRRGDVVVSQDPELTISPVTRDTAGIYSCTAQNTLGMSQPDQIQIHVQYTPRITSIGPSLHVTAKAGSSLLLSCGADGFPTPQFQWLQQLPSGEVLVRGYEPQLVIDAVTYQHQGEFVCKALNSVRGEERAVQSERITVEVNGAPLVSRYNVQTELEVMTGQDAVLEVSFCANPPPSLLWDIGAIQLADGNRHGRFVAEELRPDTARDCYVSSLRILGAHPTDSTNYSLNLENQHGSDNQDIKLHVIDKAVSQQIFIAIIVGAILTILVISLVIIYMVKADKCCAGPVPENPLKPTDLESEKTDVESTHSSVFSGLTDRTVIPPDALYCTNEKRAMVHEALFNDSKEQLRPDLLPTNLNRTNSSSGEIHVAKKVTYNELCFPKSSNYGSMKKKKQRSQGVDCRLNTPGDLINQSINSAPAGNYHRSSPQIHNHINNINRNSPVSQIIHNNATRNSFETQNNISRNSPETFSHINNLSRNSPASHHHSPAISHNHTYSYQ